MSLKFTTLNMQCPNTKQQFHDSYNKSRSLRYSDYIKKSKNKDQSKDNFNSFILKLKVKSGQNNRKNQQLQQQCQQQFSPPMKISLYQQYKQKQSIKRHKYSSSQNNTLDLSNIVIKGANLKQIYPVEWKNKKENSFNISEILHARKKQMKEISVKIKESPTTRKGLTTSVGSRIRKYFKVEENSHRNTLNTNMMSTINSNMMMNSNTNNMMGTINNNNTDNKAELHLSSIGIMGIKTSFLDKYKFKDEDHFLFSNDNIEGSCKRRQILCSVKKNRRQIIQIQPRHTKTSLSSVKNIRKRSIKVQDNINQRQDKIPCRPWSPNKDEEFQKL